MSPALAGGQLSSVPPGKSQFLFSPACLEGWKNDREQNEGRKTMMDQEMCINYVSIGNSDGVSNTGKTSLLSKR